jgi:hypothetical protein
MILGRLILVSKKTIFIYITQKNITQSHWYLKNI